MKLKSTSKIITKENFLKENNLPADIDIAFKKCLSNGKLHLIPDLIEFGCNVGTISNADIIRLLSRGQEKILDLIVEKYPAGLSKDKFLNAVERQKRIQRIKHNTLDP